MLQSKLKQSKKVRIESMDSLCKDKIKGIDFFYGDLVDLQYYFRYMA